MKRVWFYLRDLLWVPPPPQTPSQRREAERAELNRRIAVLLIELSWLEARSPLRSLAVTPLTAAVVTQAVTLRALLRDALSPSDVEKMLP